MARQEVSGRGAETSAQRSLQVGGQSTGLG